MVRIPTLKRCDEARIVAAGNAVPAASSIPRTSCTDPPSVPASLANAARAEPYSRRVWSSSFALWQGPSLASLQTAQKSYQSLVSRELVRAARPSDRRAWAEAGHAEAPEA